MDPVRPWANLNGDGPIYIPPVLSVDEADPEGKSGTRKRRRRKGKGKEKGTEEGESKENLQAELSGGGGTSRS